MIKNHISSINSKGYTIIDNIFSTKQTLEIKKKLEQVLKSREKKKQSIGVIGNYCIYNYFYDDPSLLSLIHIPIADKIFKKILDENYVLQSSNAQNRVLMKMNLKGNTNKLKLGNTWHIDSRYINGKKLNPGFSYLLIIALDTFSKKNAGTEFIPKSFKYDIGPSRHKNYKNKKVLQMKEGSICIMDTGMWHRGGQATYQSRWSIFSIYTPWWVKPYFSYKDHYDKSRRFIKKKYRKLLHYASIPPINDYNNSANTITKKF